MSYNSTDDNKSFVDDVYTEMIIGNEEDDPNTVVYPMNGIQIVKNSYTVFDLKRKYDAEPRKIKLDSEFQREDVWKEIQRAELIESVLMGLPLPIFYFNQDKYGNLIVVDGRQRLTALFQFMSGVFPLKKLKILKQVNDKYFSDLLPVYQTLIEDFQIHAYVIKPPTPDRIKFDIFDRVNRGGTQLNKQEIRNALYQGKATILLNDIVASNEFKTATGAAFINEKRMKDKYLVTRFISFYLYEKSIIKGKAGEVYKYKADLDELLGKGLDVVNSMSEPQIGELRRTILAALDHSAKYLGEDAFRLINEGRKGPVNMNVFEAIMLMMTELEISTPDEAKQLMIKQKVADWIYSDDFKENIGNRRDSAQKLQWRIDSAVRLGKELAIND